MTHFHIRLCNPKDEMGQEFLKLIHSLREAAAAAHSLEKCLCDSAPKEADYYKRLAKLVLETADTAEKEFEWRMNVGAGDNAKPYP